MDELNIPYDQWHTVPYKSTSMTDGSMKVGLHALVGYWERKAETEKRALDEIENKAKGYNEYRSPVGRCN